MDENNESLLVSVESIQELSARDCAEESSDGGGTGRSDNNDVQTVDIVGG